MVEVEEECDIPMGTWLTSSLVTGRLVLLPLRLQEHLLPQNHVSQGRKSRFLLEQQGNLKMNFFFFKEIHLTGVLSVAFLLFFFLH